MNRAPIVDRRQGARLLASAHPSAAESVVIEPEFAAGARGAFPEVRLVRARCGDGSPSEARSPAGSRRATTAAPPPG